MYLTDCSHASRRQTGLLYAAASPVGSKDGLSVAEGAISISAGQLPYRVSNDAIRLQTELSEQVNLSDLYERTEHTSLSIAHTFRTLVLDLTAENLLELLF